MDVELLSEVVAAALAVHTIKCVRAFCGVTGISPDRWVQDRGFGNSVGDEDTFLANLRLLAEMTTDCPCQSGEEWRSWFEHGLPLPVLNNWDEYHTVKLEGKG